MNPLYHSLVAEIRTRGPISLADYMARCLFDPTHGYYMRQDPLGLSGDFITAPEISQMFGELLGLALAQAWLQQGAPRPFVLAELGPGRGTLMADLLRATQIVPGFHDALVLHLVETSPALRAEQARRLARWQPVWHQSVATLPDAPVWLVANEFFDALPIRQFIRDGRGWREVVVGVIENRLVRGLSPPIPLKLLDARYRDVTMGEVVEIRPMAEPIVAELEARLSRHGGAALIVDYGSWGTRGDTFQAVAGHRPVDPFAAPGQADLTAHVDFAALAAAAPQLRHSALVPQGVLLSRLGIELRAEKLARGMSEEARKAHAAALRRLTDPAEMGQLFKALAFVPKNAPLPPGFDSPPSAWCDHDP